MGRKWFGNWLKQKQKEEKKLEQEGRSAAGR